MKLLARYDAELTTTLRMSANGVFDFTSAALKDAATHMRVQAYGGDIRWTSLKSTEAGGDAGTDPVAAGVGEKGMVLLENQVMMLRGREMRTANFLKNVSGDTVYLHLTLWKD